MGFTNKILKDVRDELAPPDDVLTAARERRDDILRIASGFPSALGTYRSGSIAHGTANADLDGDGGVVLDRRLFTAQVNPELKTIAALAYALNAEVRIVARARTSPSSRSTLRRRGSPRGSRT